MLRHAADFANQTGAKRGAHGPRRRTFGRAPAAHKHQAPCANNVNFDRQFVQRAQAREYLATG